MNLSKQKVGRNIVFCNFNEQEKSSIQFNDIRDERNSWSYCEGESHRFPYIKYVSNFKELFRSQGFMAIIKLCDINTKIDIFDKRYWKSLKKYNYIAIVDEECNQSIDFDKYSKIGFISYELFFSDSVIWVLDDMYDETLKRLSKKLSVKRYYSMEKVLKLVEQYDEISSQEIARKLDKSIRTVERYMLDLSDTECPIRYNKYSKKWYLLK